MNEASDLPETSADVIKRRAIEALRRGDFDYALRAVERGEASIPEMVEDLKIYQAELEVQNEELRAAQQVSDRAIERFSRLFSFLPMPSLVIDEFGVVNDCNEKAEQRFHLDKRLLRSHFFPRLIKGHEQAKLRRAIERAKFSGEDVLYEVVMQPVDGKPFIADIHFSLLPESPATGAMFTVIVVDQTQRLEQHEQLQKSRRHFMAYFDSSPVGMASTSSEKGWIEVNERLCQLLGYSRAELQRMTWLELTHPDDIQADEAHFNRVLKRETDTYEMDKRFIRKDGSVLEAHIAVSCVRKKNGQVDYFVAIVESIEARKHSEKLLLQREEELNRQAFELRERVKELRAIYAISRAAQQAEHMPEFIDTVLQALPAGMLHPDDVCLRVVLDDKEYAVCAGETPVATLQSDIEVYGRAVGSLTLGYLHAHADMDQGPFLKEEQALVNGVAELIARVSERIRENEDRALSMRRNAALLELTTRAADLTDMELIRHALDQVENLTNSRIAYAHFVNSDQESLSLGVWSSKTLMHCTAAFDSHYPISKAGIWADSFRQRKPVVHNDYPSYPDKKGLPSGHAELLRHVSVPVMQGEDVVMIVGVGNKPEDYDAGDLALLEVMANNSWALLQRNRSQRRLELDAEVFRNTREGVMITDADCNIISVNEAFTQITGYASEEAVGQTTRLLKSGRQSREFYQEMWAQIAAQGRWQGEIWNRRKNGDIFPQWLGISASKDELGKVREYIGVFMDIADYRAAQDRIEHLAFFDSLTGLANRRLLTDRAHQAIALAKRQDFMVGLIYLDLDHFKEINDAMGHLIGDELLVQVAERLLKCVRDTDTVCRMGGDEFVVLLNDMSSLENIIEISQKILDALAQPFDINRRVLKVSCSIGASVYPLDGQNIDELLQQADTAMYQAKNGGRNNYRLFTHEMSQRVQQQLNLRSDMQQGLKNGEFFVEYQPQYDLQTMRIIGAEALVRWQHPQLGRIAPADFIGLAEESHLIVDIGHFVMREACLQAKRWSDRGHPLRVAVNVSYMQFVRNNLLQLIRDVLQESGLPPAQLELELTESVLAADPSNVLEVVDALRDDGVYLSIDDFGTGYSSLSYLKRFPVHKLKIDQSFVRDILQDQDDRSIVLAITGLAKSLEMECIAEGVESKAQADLLMELGCRQIQGYWLARPLSVAQMDEFFNKIGDSAGGSS